jgi:hypothetical protein
MALATIWAINPIEAAGDESPRPDKNLVELARETGEHHMFLRILIPRY